MEGYDNMDNNLSNGSGIPNVSDIKFDDTPAESFENLYGGQSNNGQVNNVGVQGQSVMPNNVNVGNVQPEVSAQSSFVQNSGIVSNPSVNPTVSNVQSNVAQAQSQVNSINQGVNSLNSSVINNGAGVQSSVQSQVSVQANSIQNPGIVSNPSVNPTINNNVVQSKSQVNMVNQTVNPSVQSNNVEPVMTPNPTNITSNGADVSNVSIDAERMQSIEEQLSKTSQYNPSDFQQEQIVIPTDNQSEKNKSGLTFVIVLFVILGIAIFMLPQITKMIK